MQTPTNVNGNCMDDNTPIPYFLKQSMTKEMNVQCEKITAIQAVEEGEDGDIDNNLNAIFDVEPLGSESQSNSLSEFFANFIPDDDKDFLSLVHTHEQSTAVENNSIPFFPVTLIHIQMKG